MELKEDWGGVLPFGEFEGEMIDEFEHEDAEAYFGFRHLDSESLIVIYCDEQIIEIIGVDDQKVSAEIYIQVSEEELWTAIRELLDDLGWGLTITAGEMTDQLVKGAKEEQQRFSDE